MWTFIQNIEIITQGSQAHIVSFPEKQKLCNKFTWNVIMTITWTRNLRMMRIVQFWIIPMLVVIGLD